MKSAVGNAENLSERSAMSDWEPDTENGGPVHLGPDLQEEIDRRRRPGESPNQCLTRILVDTEEDDLASDLAKDVIENLRPEIRTIAREEAEDVVEEEKRRR